MPERLDVLIVDAGSDGIGATDNELIQNHTKADRRILFYPNMIRSMTSTSSPICMRHSRQHFGGTTADPCLRPDR
jgi:hypothetical protein